MGSGLLLGCIADDFTGATDLANNLVRSGMRTVQTIGVPAGPLEVSTDAVVVALKTRTTPPAEAVQQSLEALRWLQAQGARQIYFKYCSTFDSTAHGNIGPVTEALMDALGADFTIATPAFPDNQRTVFKGYLFVGDVLLSESGMRDHPLTPMTDANLVRVLQAQCRRKVGLIDYRTVAAGEAAIRAAHRRPALRGRVDRRGRRAEQRRPAAPGAGAEGPEAGHGRFRRRHRAAGKLRPARLRRRQPAAVRARRARGGRGQLFRGDQSAGARFHGGRRSRDGDRSAADRGGRQTWSRRRWPGPSRCWPRARCWSIPRQTRAR